MDQCLLPKELTKKLVFQQLLLETTTMVKAHLESMQLWNQDTWVLLQFW